MSVESQSLLLSFICTFFLFTFHLPVATHITSLRHTVAYPSPLTRPKGGAESVPLVTFHTTEEGYEYIDVEQHRTPSKAKIVKHSEKCANYEKSWNNMNTVWNNRIHDKDQMLCALETGGGGDCFFSSVAAGLKRANITRLDGKPYTVKGLRHIAASEFVGYRTEDDACTRTKDWKAAEFMDKLEALAGIDDWNDAWLPSEILKYPIYVTKSTRAVLNTTTPEQKAHATYLELSSAGATHLGGDFDVAMLEQYFDIGIILLNDSTGKVYPAARKNVRRKLYIFIQYVPGHYRLGGLVDLQRDEFGEGIKTNFKPSELPEWIFDYYETDCKVPLM